MQLQTLFCPLSEPHTTGNSQPSSNRIAPIDLRRGRRAHSGLSNASCCVLSVRLLCCKLCLLCCQLCALTSHHALLLLRSHESAVICESGRLVSERLRGLSCRSIHHRNLGYGVLDVWSAVLLISWGWRRVRRAGLCRRRLRAVQRLLRGSLTSKINVCVLVVCVIQSIRGRLCLVLVTRLARVPTIHCVLRRCLRDMLIVLA
jgi:hypothetical protein